jgi:hypothetical protein
VPVSHVVIVPSAPMLVPAASSAQPPDVAAPLADLRAQVTTALLTLPENGSVLLLDPGPESVVHDAEIASLAGYGLANVRADVPIDGDLLTAVSARGQAPRVRSDRLDGDAAVVALLLAEHRPDLALAPVTVPVGASAFGLHGITLGLEAAIKAVTDGEPRHRVAVVATGDLAATLTVISPGYLVEGAEDWDAEVVDAVRACDVDRLGELGPADALRYQARGWAPLVVALHLAIAAGRRFQQVDYAAPRGVGQLTAS